MNNDNKKDDVLAPSLDLSFAYGTTVVKHLTENDIAALAAKEAVDAEAEGSTGDTTIRSVTSLFAGKRKIVGFGLGSDDDEA